MVTRCLVAIVILGLSGIYAAALRHGRPVSERIPRLEQLPAELNGWRSQDIPPDKETMDVLAADATLQRLYTGSQGQDVGVFVAYFAQQQVNSQIHSPRNCLPGGGWRPIFIGRKNLTVGGVNREATRMVVRRNARQLDVLYWFRTRSGDRSSEYALKWDLVKNSLARRPTDAAFIRYDAASADSAAMGAFIAQFQPQIDHVLAGVGL